MHHTDYRPSEELLLEILGTSDFNIQVKRLLAEAYQRGFLKAWADIYRLEAAIKTVKESLPSENLS